MHKTGHSRPIRPMSRLYNFLLLLIIIPSVFVPVCKATAGSDEVWLLVDTGEQTLAVMRGESLLQRYENIAIGSNGPSLVRRKSDETTPLGEFRISGINPRSRFHLFMALDYPTVEVAQRALADGRIDAGEYSAVGKAWLFGEPPPQNTRLGGYLGIHGLGAASPEVHKRVNWTDGCIAVTNEQIDELAHWVVVGTRVSIR